MKMFTVIKDNCSEVQPSFNESISKKRLRLLQNNLIKKPLNKAKNLNRRKKLYVNSDQDSVSKRSSCYRGVSRNGDSWQVLIMVKKVKRYIGTYNDEQTAAKVYDKVAIQNHKNKAKTNFFYTDDEIKQILSEDHILTVD